MQQAAFQSCMVAHGFPTPPGDDTDRRQTAAYELVAIGDDGRDDGGDRIPAARTVEVAPGVTRSLYVTWTPASCTYRSYRAVGVDAYQFEATRQQMQVLLYQADRAADARLGPLARTWGACLGDDDAQPQDLLNAIDGAARGPYGDQAGSCLTADLEQEAVRVRAAAHLAVAADHQGVVDAWVGLVDTEDATAGA